MYRFGNVGPLLYLLRCQLNEGVVGLLGYVNSLLLVAFIKLRRREGMGVPEASALASKQRFRAVVLTSLTTMAGLTPLLAERSLQAQILIPLGTSLVFGLIASTVLILIVLPAFYTVLDDFGVAAHVARRDEEDDEGEGAADDAPDDAAAEADGS